MKACLHDTLHVIVSIQNDKKKIYFGILHLRALTVYFLLDRFPEFMFEYPFIYCSLQITKWYIFLMKSLIHNRYVTFVSWVPHHYVDLVAK